MFKIHFVLQSLKRIKLTHYHKTNNISSKDYHDFLPLIFEILVLSTLSKKSRPAERSISSRGT